jgi:hypothetical protein
MGIATTLGKLSPSLYRLRILTIIVALLVLPFVVFYLLYVRSQTAYFTERSFRSLSLISSQIASKVETAGLVLKNGSEKFINPKGETDSAFDPQNLEQLKEVFKTLRDDSSEIIPISIESKAGEDQTSPSSVTLTAVRQEADSTWLYLNYVSEPTASKKVVTVQAKADLNSLVRPILSRRDNIGASDRDQFQNILIAERATGRVIFQLDSSEIRLVSLDKLTLADNEGKKTDIKEMGQASNVVDVALAGSNYKLFFHPIELALPSTTANAPNTAWVTSGFIRSESFRKESWSISYTVLIFCAFVTVLLILSWPFLKLVLIGPKDRLRTADVYFLIFSTVVVLAVLTCFGAYGYAYWKVENQMDAQLKQLATAIKANFNEELTQALQQLDILSKNCNLLKKLDSSTICSNTPDNPTDIFQQGVTDKKSILPELLSSANNKYPYFDTAVWLDSEGWQKAKWTVKNETTQYINVSGRAYFNRIRQGDYRELQGHRFWLEPIVSKTTGRNEVEISQRTANPEWIAAFDTRLVSLMEPVLPTGFGYLIIDNDGKVLFHSDEAHHLGENFVQESDDDPELRSAIVGRTDITLNVRYLGEGQRLFITPTDGFPEWSLVVFRNKQILRGSFLEMLTLVSLLFLIYSLILLICLSVFYLINLENKRREWLWPCPQKTSIYYQSFLLMLLLSGISVFFLVYLRGQNLVFVVAAVAFLSLLTFFLNLRFGKSRPWLTGWASISRATNPFSRYDRAYVINLTFLLLLIAILPAAAFFKYAYESEMKLLIKHGQFTLASALAKRDERIRRQYSHIVITEEKEKPKAQPAIADTTGQHHPKESEERRARPQTTTPTNEETNPLIGRRLALDWDVYDKFFFDTSRENPDQLTCMKDTSSELLSKLDTFLPLYSQTSVERRGLLSNSAAAGVCKWEVGDKGRLVLHLDANSVRTEAWPWRHMATLVPSLAVPGAPWITLFILSYIPFFMFVHFIVRKVFLLDVYRPTSYPLKKLLNETLDRNLFVVLDEPFTGKRVFDSDRLQVLDLHSLANSPDWGDKFDYNKLPDKEAIALDHFDYKLDDAQANLQKMSLVGRLLDRGKTLIILSDAEPSQYRLNEGDAGNVNGIEAGGHWAGLMSQFFKEYGEDTGDRQAFHDVVEKEKERILGQDLEGRSVEDVTKLINIVYTECAPKLPLQNSGLHILRQKRFVTLTPDHLLNRIINQAKTYYDDIWDTCSLDEKLTLFHLAQDRLLSHRDPDIQRLLRRELIVRNVDVHLMNESFRHFVKSTEQVAFVAEHEQKAKQGSLWHTLKVPLLVVLVAITIFLFSTQRDLYTSSLAIVTAVTTIIPAFFKVLTLFQADPLGRPPSQN